MVAINDPAREMREELKEIDKKVKRISKIVEGGFISRRLGKYTEQLLMMDFNLKEVAFRHKNPGYGDPIEPLVEMKLSLDSIAGMFMNNEPIEEMRSGLYIIENPNFEEMEKNRKKYQELYDLARKRYDEAVEDYGKLLGAVA